MENNNSGQPTPFHWNPLFLGLLCAFSTFPLMGHLVRANNVPQWFFLPVALLWLCSCVATLLLIVIALIDPPRTLIQRIIAVLVFFYLLGISVAGFGGVKHCFFELVAG